MGGGGTPLHYAIMVSGAEDVDNDGVPLTVDTCDNPDVGAFPAGNGLTSASGATDTDGGGLGDSCDPDPGSTDNCPGAAPVVKSAARNAAGEPGALPDQAVGLHLRCLGQLRPEQ